MKFEFKSLFDLQSAFPDEQSCIDHLENMIWGDVIISPFDATSKVYKCKAVNLLFYSNKDRNIKDNITNHLCVKFF